MPLVPAGIQKLWEIASLGRTSTVFPTAHRSYTHSRALLTNRLYVVEAALNVFEHNKTKDMNAKELKLVKGTGLIVTTLDIASTATVSTNSSHSPLVSLVANNTTTQV